MDVVALHQRAGASGASGRSVVMVATPFSIESVGAAPHRPRAGSNRNSETKFSTALSRKKYLNSNKSLRRQRLVGARLTAGGLGRGNALACEGLSPAGNAQKHLVRSFSLGRCNKIGQSRWLIRRPARIRRTMRIRHTAIGSPAAGRCGVQVLPF